MRISDWNSDVCSSDLHPLTQMERCAYADIIQYRFASPFMTDNLIRWFQAGRNDETRQAHYLICHDYHVLSEAMLRCDCVGICTEPMLDYLSEHYELCRLDVDGFKMQVLVNCIYRRVQEFSRSTGALIAMIEDKMKAL